MARLNDGIGQNSALALASAKLSVLGGRAHRHRCDGSTASTRYQGVVIPTCNSDIDAPALREYLKGRVSRFEQPRDIHVVASIPRNPAGKVVRAELST